MEDKKICSSCKVKKQFADFHKSTRSKNGYTPYCKLCAKSKAKEWYQRNPKERAENQRNWYIKHRGAIRKRKYGLNDKDYNELFLKQRGKCVICRLSFSELIPACVDHDHTTKKIRGLLCRKCNLKVGWLENERRFVKLAFKYLGNY